MMSTNSRSQLRYIKIDLTTTHVREYPIVPEIVRDYIGGKALAARIMLDETEKGVDPFCEKNLLIFNTGPLTGTAAPGSALFNVTSKSVLSGGIASSECTGAFGIKLRQSGYDGLIISGRSKSPVTIEINDRKVSFRDAGHLWGLDCEKSQRLLPDTFGKAIIGPAGENRVRYAAIISGDRSAGRGGLGAVMGAKNLKAVICNGSEAVPIAESESYRQLCKKWFRRLRRHPMTGDFLPRLGTMGFVSIAHRQGILPVKNYTPVAPATSTAITSVHSLSGEYFAERFLQKKSGCFSCPIRCEQRVIWEGKSIKGPEYETVALLGSNILNDDLERIIGWNYLADLYGLDTISLGGTLAFAMELKERGMADLGPDFGQPDELDRIIGDIAYRRGSGDELANGVQWLAGKYGGSDFAVHAKGLELSAYNPESLAGMSLGYATANRGGCHLDGGNLAYLEGIGPVRMRSRQVAGKAFWTVTMQDLLAAVAVSGSCFFTSFAMFPGLLYRLKPGGIASRLAAAFFSSSRVLLAPLLKWGGLTRLNVPLIPYSRALGHVLGRKMSLGDFLTMGERAFNVERLFNCREGLTSGSDTFCRRLSPHPFLQKNKRRYYRLRGWDASGRPTNKTLKRLRIKNRLAGE